MKSILKTTFLLFGLLAAMGLQASTPPAEKPTAKIHFEIYKAGFVVGISGGSGTLTVNGRDYPISIGGVSLGATIGASKAEFTGDVQHLSVAEDIEGIYSGAQAGAAAAGGAKITKLKNSKGVVLVVSGKQVGLEFSLDLNGMQIKLKK
jgi:hypothetical protein